jgi:hypothetical protein
VDSNVILSIAELAFAFLNEKIKNKKKKIKSFASFGDLFLSIFFIFGWKGVMKKTVQATSRLQSLMYYCAQMA